jgi:hypothetical protein
LLFSTINPIFEKSTRFFLKEVLRLSGKTCLYFEVQSKTVIPTIFHELIHVRSRRFPHFLDKKWDHERWENKSSSTSAEDEPDKDFKVPVDGGERKADDETESPFALCFTSKKLLSEAKIVKNARVVIIGASDTGISFAEALLYHLSPIHTNHTDCSWWPPTSSFTHEEVKPQDSKHKLHQYGTPKTHA